MACIHTLRQRALLEQGATYYIYPQLQVSTGNCRSNGDHLEQALFDRGCLQLHPDSLKISYTIISRVLRDSSLQNLLKLLPLLEYH